MSPDPFYIKQYAKWNPKRFFPTLRARVDNRIAVMRFAAYALPSKTVDPLPQLGYVPEWTNTALGQIDMQYLLYACQLCSQDGIEGACVEVGCFRGVTTRLLATARYPALTVAVDPYFGYGGDARDYELFRLATEGLDNIKHMRMTSGDAFRAWKDGPVAVVFIDAVHNYPNTRFDLEAWGSMLRSGGIIAAHDTDNPAFAGTRRAVYEASRREYDMLAHPPNLTLLRKH